MTEELCARAIAYLKVKETDRLAEAVVLSRPDSPIIRSLDNGFAVTYVADVGANLQYIQQRTLDQEGWDAERLHSTALGNLASLAKSKLRIQSYGKIFAVFLDGNFEASLILLDALWDNAICHLAPNGFVAALPTRDVLAFCDVESVEGKTELGGVVDRLKNGDHLLTRQLFQRRKGQWVPFRQ